MSIHQNIEGAQSSKEALYEKKQVIKRVMEEYTINKIKQLGLTYEETKEYDDTNKLFDMLDFIDCNIGDENRHSFFNKYTYCVLSLVGTMQGCAVVWDKEVDRTYVEASTIEYDYRGWRTLRTHIKSDPLIVAKTVIRSFYKDLESLYKKPTYQKSLTKKISEE